MVYGFVAIIAFHCLAGLEAINFNLVAGSDGNYGIAFIGFSLYGILTWGNLGD